MFIMATFNDLYQSGWRRTQGIQRAQTSPATGYILLERDGQYLITVFADGVDHSGYRGNTAIVQWDEAEVYEETRRVCRRKLTVTENANA